MRLLLLSTADTDLLAALRAGQSDHVREEGSEDGDDQIVFRVANPARTAPDEVAGLLEDVDMVVLRLLGGSRAWPEGVEAVLASGLPVVCLGGEVAADADLMARSTVPAGVATEVMNYLVEGGPQNLRQLGRFCSDTVLLTGHGFEAPGSPPEYGVAAGVHTAEVDPQRPTVGVIYYRAHELAGNTDFVQQLAGDLEAAGSNVLPIFAPSLRGISWADEAYEPLYALLSRCDALVTTVLAAGGSAAAQASAGGEEEAWDAGALAELDVSVLQGLCLTSDRSTWAESDAALTPMDAAMQVAIPEFDGRIVGVPFSFKQPGEFGIPVYVADAERSRRLAGIATNLARLRHTPAAQRRIAVVLSSYPTKHSRVGNAVGLDTPASAVILLRELQRAGYWLGDFDAERADGDALIHELIAAGGHDTEWLTEEQMTSAAIRVPSERYRRWFAELPEALQRSMAEHWGPPPGTLYTAGDEIYTAALRFGNVMLMIQPPRGFGENPVAIYHDPDLPPSHQYYSAYRYLAEGEQHGGFGAQAVVHLGKHGTLEWLPGKGLGLAADCAPDAVLGDLPLIYPFIVNDPGEGSQAKRRGHAVVVDHMIPPMARADTYGDMAKLEQLLDEYAQVQEMDPDKMPALRGQIWTLIQAAQLHHDLHQDEQPDAADFDDFVLHVDGYLCEVKDVQIRDGLHILGRAPQHEELVNDVLAVLRARQIFGGSTGAQPGLRAALADYLGLDEQRLLADAGARVEAPEAIKLISTLADGPAVSAADVVDRLEDLARRLVEGMAAAGWEPGSGDPVAASVMRPAADLAGQRPAELSRLAGVLDFACTELVPRLARTTDEVTNVLRALEGRYIEPGPSGSPTRGLVSVLPTGRNFFSVDPKAIPSRNAFDTGAALADSLLERHRADIGQWPSSVGLTVWGTSAMRTQGDDIAEVLWLLGCRPTWDDASRRVTGFEVVPVAELGRPRVDVVVRISGFFRDAFPHVIALLDDAVRAVAELPEEAAENYVAAHYRADLAEHSDARRASARIFGSRPGAYGAGLLPLIDARNWRTDADLAEVYATWGGYAYGKGLDGVGARQDMETAFRRIQVAAKNVDTREHDIADSDDYFQYHGGMVATVRHLTGADPSAYIGDSAVPHAVKTRSLGEETKRVFRARVVNPKWISAMQRHGYKGAFELAATVDYLFGFDATAGVVDDWMYTRLAESYVFDEQVHDFLEQSNPWALRGMTERLLEAADRGLWAEPDPDTLRRLREEYLQLEGRLED